MGLKPVIATAVFYVRLCQKMGTRANAVDTIYCWLKTPSTGVLFYYKNLGGIFIMIKEKQHSETNKLIIFIFTLFLMAITGFICYAAGRGASVAESTSNPDLLQQCQKPYQDEQDSAKIDLQYQQSGRDYSGEYQALTTSAQGLQSCQDKYGG